MSADSKVKVKDKRRFTPDGELKEDYREEAENGAPEPLKTPPEDGASVSPEPEPEPEPRAEEPPLEPPDAEAPATAPSTEEPSTERAENPPGPLGQPSVMDLISILAEPVAVYLGDTKLPDGRSAQNFDLARFHIDLLDLLREKTRGNLSAQESSVLDDLVYRLRMLYVEKRK